MRFWVICSWSNFVIGRAASFIIAIAFIIFGFGCGPKQPNIKQPNITKLPEVPVHQELLRRLQSHQFPKLMNQIQFCCATPENRALFKQLAYWDLITVEPGTIFKLPEFHGPGGIIRSRNPGAVVLVYFSAGDVNPTYKEPTVFGFNSRVDPAWYLRDINQDKVRLYELRSSEWTFAQNPATPVNRFLPEYLSEVVLSTNAVDGIFYDWATTSISWLNHTKPPRSGPIDIDNDGKADSDAKIDRIWTEGFSKMLNNSRKMFPPGSLILGNAGWNSGTQYSSALNGVMMEQFMEGANKDSRSFGWTALMRTYDRYLQTSVAPRVSIIMANDDNEKNFQKMRFSLASALMFDGYFCLTNRTNAYGTCRWYDEYSVDVRSGKALQAMEFKGYLGKPVSDAFNAEDPEEHLQKMLQKNNSKTETIVWRRNFQNGIVLVNPDKKDRSIELKDAYRKILGSIDPLFNDGSVITAISMAGRSGAILLNQD